MKSPLKKTAPGPLFSYGNYRMATGVLKGIIQPLQRLGLHLPALRTRLQHMAGDIPPLQPSQNPHIWIHGASLGEAGVTESLVYSLHAQLRGQCRFTLSACTETGLALLRKRLEGKAAFVFAPLDLPGWPEAALEARPPDVMVFVETEIWPNWIQGCTARNIPTLMVNGRISPRSFPRYLRIRPLLRDIFREVRAFSMISQTDAHRILALGAPEDRIQVCGNAKRDPASFAPAARLSLSLHRKNLGIGEKDLIWICGSIRKGEDIPILAAFSEVKKAFPHLRMILAPRHLKRLRAMERTASEKGLTHQRRSREARFKSDILFLDTMGELRTLYALADVVFCGGSLVPAGGQNLLEAAAWAKPILFGPSMEDFAEEKELLLAAGAAFEVKDATELAAQLAWLLGFPEKARAAGSAGLKALQQNQGAVSCHTRAILQALASHSGRSGHGHPF
ncbi:3-deoxy-D-manno-octulosonic acid transferase [Desulfobotulus sp.]|uniref:3-deoxy-D-manno-octulosonic acid transferase n=1 Tax=Desulfobotulus sp. TaxID=1940337 RepID=UPI002A37095E|nr:glycosyltransferase N-terminal domain-containing protein [Desulfobotulus sp.]